MTVLRRHLFAILAVCAALAVGIALGAGPLQGDSGAADEAALQSDNTGLSDRVAQLEQTRVFDDAMTKAASSGLVSGRLSGRTLTLVVLPGVPGATVDGVRTAVQQAGGSTAVTAVVQPDMVDPAKKTYVDSVAANSMKGLKDLGPGAKGETYDQVAALVARA